MKKFIYGLLMGAVGLSVVEALGELTLTWIEATKIPAIKKTLQGNKDIANLQEEAEYQEKQPLIGFHYEPAEEYYEDEEE